MRAGGGAVTTPLWVLLGFALWTLAVLTATVGVYRWRRILAGRTPIGGFRYDSAGHEDWYRRAMRAHANCIENLPVYGAIALILVVTRLDTPAIDALAIALMIARVCQTLVHVGFVETNAAVSVRFGFYAAQAAAMFAMSGIVIARLA
jgi:uncharacterized MAPEG superfamily protein